MKKLSNKRLLTTIISLITSLQCLSQSTTPTGLRQLILVDATQQIEVFVYGSGSTALIMASGNGRPGIQMEGMAKAIAKKGIKVIIYNYRTQ